jgi:translation elongation factor EF-Tu-like GTPase
MEEHLLFIVEDAFQIRDRGCVLAPGVPTEPEAPVVKVGSSIALLTPNGRTILTSVKGIEILNFGSQRPVKITAPILLPKEVTKDLVPKGTKVFLVVQ